MDDGAIPPAVPASTRTSARVKRVPERGSPTAVSMLVGSHGIVSRPRRGECHAVRKHEHVVDVAVRRGIGQDDFCVVGLSFRSNQSTVHLTL